MPREEASRALDRYELAYAAEQAFGSLFGGQQARCQVLLLELSGATLLLLDEPTDNLALQSAEALEDGLERLDGSVLAGAHDRLFARSFDRFLIFGADGSGYEASGRSWTRPASSESADPAAPPRRQLDSGPPRAACLSLARVTDRARVEMITSS